MKISRLAIAFFCLCHGAAAHAHGDLHEQIEEVSAAIAQAPSAALFLKRGELHRAHRDFEPALADYDDAELLEPEMEALFFARGRALFEADGSRRRGSRWIVS